MPWFNTISLGALILCSVATCRADVLYDNTGQGIFGEDPVVLDGPQYNSFTTGASGLLNTVTLLLDSGRVPNRAGAVDVAVYGDGGNFPRNLVANLGDVADNQLHTIPRPFTFRVNLTLDGHTRYWIGLTDVTPNGMGSSSIEWAFAADASGAQVAGEWNDNALTGPLPNGDGSNGTGTPYMMCASTSSSPSGCAAAAIPEPASLPLLCLGLGLLGLGAVSRRPSAL
jgi:hypothetical protein